MSGELVYGGPLSERKKRILRSIIEAHIEMGEPIGSKYLVSSAAIPFSSATIRNEMSELEEMGYLEQPHTSAGRIPTRLGYRFYVDSLLEKYAMTTNEIAQINALLKVKMGELDRILLAASNLASSMTNYTGIAIKPRVSSISVEKFETIYLDPSHYILIAVDATGNVKSKHLHSEQGRFTPAAVEKLAKKFDIETQVLEPGCPSGLTNPNSEAFLLVKKAVSQVFPGVVTSPYLMTGASDSRFFSRICDNCVRFVPFLISQDQMDRIHGIDENVDVSTLAPAVDFYKCILTEAGR